jgi:hypothetical protein
MLAPLFFDLDANRYRKRYTWRHLTVGEERKAVTDDKAVAYRIQIGNEQFAFYYSIHEKANRTFLGHNLIDNLCFARFSSKTGVEPLIGVQEE